jgi:hypothetical protein
LLSNFDDDQLHAPRFPTITQQQTVHSDQEKISIGALVADSLNVVAQRILEEGGIVPLVVVRPDARRAIVLATMLQRCSVEGVDARFVCSR